MASVFLMQPVGQLFAYAVGLGCLVTPPTRGVDRVSIDRLWRVVVGAGVGPALLAVVFRRSIPESWRFDYFVTFNESNNHYFIVSEITENSFKNA